MLRFSFCSLRFGWLSFLRFRQIGVEGKAVVVGALLRLLLRKILRLSGVRSRSLKPKRSTNQVALGER
jgi:hypothetical protein